MSTIQVWNNIVAYALQIGLLVAIGAMMPPIIRPRTSRARLLFWQSLLAACLLLPWVQPWRQQVINMTVAPVAPLPATDRPAAAGLPIVVTAPLDHAIPFTTIILYMLAIGVLIRLVWLGIGLARLAGYRQRGRPLASDPVFSRATVSRVRWLVSDEIPGPVTFGWRDPVVLLPACFPSLSVALREAILCHELIHVDRSDWIFTLAEEFVRALFWFHPAVWWVLGEIQLAREQAVDEEAIEVTHTRESYVDALLAMAGAETPAQFDLAPAPLFLRRRHLKQRVIGLLQEAPVARISKIRIVLGQAVAVAAIVAACWIASGIFPLDAAPQVVADDAGVLVNTGDAKLVYRTPVAYPFEALQKGVEGKVIIEADVDADGDVSETSVVRCPRELCAGAVDSLPGWKFDPRQANTKRSVRIDFARPAVAQALMPVLPGLMASTTIAQAQQSQMVFVANTISLDGNYVMFASAAARNTFGHTLSGILVNGLPAPAAGQLEAQLPVQAGDVWSEATGTAVLQIVAAFAPNLEVDLLSDPQSKQWTLLIGPPLRMFGQVPIAAVPLPPGVYAAGHGVAPPHVISKVDPEYSQTAQNAKISGTVSLSVVVGADGTPQNIQVVGPLDPGLDQKAAAALARWRFKPGTKDSASVSVQALVQMTFTAL